MNRVNIEERHIRYVIEPLILPKRSYGAHIEVYRNGPRGGAPRYVKVGPRVVADLPQKALEDLRVALYTDRLPDVRIVPSEASDA